VEPSLFDVVGDPVGFVVVGNDFVANVLYPYKPGWNGFVDERRVGSPAVGI